MDDTLTADDRALLAKAKMIGRLADEVETGASALGRLRELLAQPTTVRHGGMEGDDRGDASTVTVTATDGNMEAIGEPKARLVGEMTKESVHRLRNTGMSGVKIAETLGISRAAVYQHLANYRKPARVKAKSHAPAEAIAEPPESEETGELDEALDRMPAATFWQCTMCDRKHFTVGKPERCEGCLETTLVQKAA